MSLQRVTILFMLCVLFTSNLAARKNILLKEFKRERPGKSLDIHQVQGYINDDNTITIEFPKSYGEIDVFVTYNDSNQVIYQDNHLIIEPITLTIHLTRELNEGFYRINIDTKESVINGDFDIN